MSLILCYPTHHGIVMSADHRIMANIINPDQSKSTFLLTDHEQKLFLVNDSYGLGFVGDNDIDGVPLSSILPALTNEYLFTDFDPCVFLKWLMSELLTRGRDFKSLIYICGYNNKKPFIFTINEKKRFLKISPVIKILV